ncbi:GNAT family N-acetyltransferase [Ferrimonas lipolytica]|uniref:GNAT family N-acetyltransferase n=1 Tax=Ferrimonas lipolytica TaxID=2724191 RepID=A0A6H1UBF5_9GAMM|nr:GNAT family N-acetyltransferase [Ferrimonas lipolytica]QIZ76417.1 GNAT family N-acetyltransferase [Ferrimonas lipolytica]
MESERLRFAPPSLQHQPLMLAAIIESQLELSQFLPWVSSALTEQESVASMKQAIDDFANYQNELRFSLFEKESDEFIGAIGLFIRDKSVPYFEIGYWLRTAYVGHGYITEAVNTIEHHTFVELDAERIEIRTDVNNDKSRAVAIRCGYQFEGIHYCDHRLPNGDLSDTAVYAKTR